MEDPDKEENVIAELKELKSEVKHINNYLESSSGQKWYVSRKGQIRVLITPTLFSLRDVDTVKQEFSAELWYEIFYKDKTLAGKTKREDVDWDNQWDPRISLRNTVTIENESSAQNLLPVVGEDVPIVHEFRKVRATFKVDMDLTDFPVDHQKLTVHMMSGWPLKKADLRKNYGSNDTINDEDFADGDQWNVSKYLDCKSLKKGNSQSKSFSEYPMYNITAHVQRKSTFYKWNTVLILFLIMALSFTVFFIPIAEYKDRLGVIFTLLLTTVAFKLVVSQYLPTVSYLTLLDKYVLACVIFQFAVAVQSTVASVIWDKNSAKLFDWVSAGLFVVVVLLAHLIFGIYIRKKMNEKDREMRMIQEKYKHLKERVDKAYEKREMDERHGIEVAGSTKCNMIIKGFTDEEVKEFESKDESDGEDKPLVACA